MAPKKKRPWLLIFILLALVGIGVTVGLNRSLREAILAKISPKHEQPVADPSATAALSAPSITSAVVPPPIASSAPAASVSAAPSASVAPSASASAKPAPKPTVHRPPPRKH